MRTYDDLLKWSRDLEDELETVKRQLRTIVGGEGEHKWHALRLHPSEEKVLRLLLLRDFVPHEAIETALYWDKDFIGADATIKVFICGIKRKLPFLRPWLVCRRGEGYWLHPEGKHRLLFELKNPGVAKAAAV